MKTSALVAALLALSLSACDKKTEAPAAEQAPAPAAIAAPEPVASAPAAEAASAPAVAPAAPEKDAKPAD